MDHTVLSANTPCLPFLRKRSPDGATPNSGRRHAIAACSLLLIYRPRRGERLSWPGWLTEFAGQRLTFYRCAMQSTGAVAV